MNVRHLAGIPEMAKKLFGLRGVPEDEAEDVRQLLSRHGIDYYETSAGNWGISMPAIWLDDEHQYDQARKLIDDYQEERSVRMRREYEQRKSTGQYETLADRIRQAPLTFVFYIAIIIFLLYLFIGPFVSIGQ